MAPVAEAAVDAAGAESPNRADRPTDSGESRGGPAEDDRAIDAETAAHERERS
jgi:hypothetical protein